jgi:hypothetical protein
MNLLDHNQWNQIEGTCTETGGGEGAVREDAQGAKGRFVRGPRVSQQQKAKHFTR